MNSSNFLLIIEVFFFNFFLFLFFVCLLLFILLLIISKKKKKKKKKIAHLDPKTTIGLLTSYGLVDPLLHYAKLSGLYIYKLMNYKK